MKHIPIFFIRIYQKFLSPLLPPSCRFTPTCSAYAITAFQKRGFFMGLYLSITRILRCNPFCKAGYDPVPEKGSKIRKPIPKYKSPVRRNGDKNRNFPQNQVKDTVKDSTPS